ncbi:MAG: hypothetical protein ACRDNH_12985 [Gaiellaceae bacterium]
MRCGRSFIIVIALLALVLVPGAHGEEINGYTATGSPSHVKPLTLSSYTIVLTNTSLDRSADAASIGIPAGFVVLPTVQATASCGTPTWTVEAPVPSVDGKIKVRRGAGGSANNLCPGGTLTIGFSATSSAVEGTYVWATELLRGEEDTFVLNGPQPSVTVDGTPPTVAITKKPNDPSGVSSAVFEFAASESATFQCSLDGAVQTCSSPKNYTVPDGLHTFAVWARDPAGNIGEAETYSWLVETDLPVVTLTDMPDKASNIPAASFLFTASKPSASFQCRLDGGEFSPCSSPKTYTGLADGAHTFRIKATGAAGTGPETVYAWTIDTTGPATAITEKPADPTNSRSASFAFNASEPATFQCKLDDGAFATCGSPQSYGGLAEGRHTFVVRATDALNNVGSDTTYSWTIEMRAPVLTITSGPAGLSNSTSVSVSFSADEPATFQCSLDDRGFEPCSSPAAYASLREGGHSLTVRATDAAGNVAAASRAWTTDATPPQTTLVSRPKAKTATRLATFAFSANEPGAFQCRLDAGSYAPCKSPKSYTRLKDGVHRFMVRAIDAAGNVDAVPAVARWTIGTAVVRNAAVSALFAPAAGARVTRPPLLRWRGVPRAAFYNVQLYKAGRKVLTAWPRRTRLQLQARWRFNGRAERFRPGQYRWYVWPAYANRRFGKLVGTSTFVFVRRQG